MKRECSTRVPHWARIARCWPRPEVKEVGQQRLYAHRRSRWAPGGTRCDSEECYLDRAQCYPCFEPKLLPMY